jgi:hypothetical protein
MRFVSVAMLLAALPACDRIFGLTDTTVIHGDDTGGDDAGNEGIDAPPVCTGASCFTIVAPSQSGAREIVSDPSRKLLAWNLNALSSIGSIAGCAAASCMPTMYVTGSEVRPHSLLHDGKRVMWAVTDSIYDVNINGGASFANSVYSPPSIPGPGAVASFVLAGDCWLVINGSVFHGTYDASLLKCGDIQGASNIYNDSVFVDNGEVTSDLARLVDATNAVFPIVGTPHGVYVYAPDSNIQDIYGGIVSSNHLAATPQWIVGIQDGTPIVSGAAVGLSTEDTPSIALQSNAIAIEANAAGEIYVGTEAGEIIRVATNAMFGVPTSVVSGIPTLRDFTFDNAGNIFAISGDNIIEIAAQ